VLPDKREELERSCNDNRNGVFRKGSSIYGIIRYQVAKFNKSLCGDHSNAFDKNLNDPAVVQTWKQVFPPAARGQQPPKGNFSPVHGKPAVDGMASYFRFLYQDFDDDALPDVFKSFFQKDEVKRLLENKDRFITCFGLGDNNEPVLDFGFVRKNEVDVFRSTYMRGAKRTYNATFEGISYVCLMLCRSVRWRPGSQR
jgi:hypothetical protein